MKNGEKVTFWAIFGGAADFGPNFSRSHMLEIGQISQITPFGACLGSKFTLNVYISVMKT